MKKAGEEGWYGGSHPREWGTIQYHKPGAAVVKIQQEKPGTGACGAAVFGTIVGLSVLGVCAAFAASIFLPATSLAQSAGSGFLFSQPAGSITLSGGYANASASGDLFSFVTNELTLEKRDFSGPLLGLDVAVRVAPRFDVVFNTSYSGTSTPSHYREFIDENDAEITQTTDFKRVPVMVSLRAYLTSQGRSVGKFAWVPSRLAPYVGIGGGAVWYKFHQYGYFVDVQDSNSVFPSDLSSSKWTPAAQGIAGVDFTISPHVALTGEAKYIWAKGSLDQSFSGFDNIDLSGLSATIGLTYRY